MGNPQVSPTGHFRVLVVCIGNVCRSPLAEGLLVRAAKEHGLPITTRSAGVKALAGWEMDPHTQELLRVRRVDPSGFRAQQLTADHLVDADLVLTATRGIRSTALQLHPGAVRRTFTLTEAAVLASPTVVRGSGTLQEWVDAAVRHRQDVGRVDLDVPDPRGQRTKVHKQVGQIIDRAVTELVAGWTQWLGEPIRPISAPDRG